LVALMQAATIMLLPDEKLEAKARVQFEDTHQVHGRRGDVFDRNGALLATTVVANPRGQHEAQLQGPGDEECSALRL